LSSRQITLVTRESVPRPDEDAPATGDHASGTAAPARPKSPVEITAALLRGRWTAVVVWHLFWGGKRFYQLVREIEGIPRRALAHELEDLERVGIVERRVQHLGPAKVEYSLTRLGDSLKIVVGAMYEWGLVAMRQKAIAAEGRDERPAVEHDTL
jgi:DNA-binding HxlR family transcriptional regulator